MAASADVLKFALMIIFVFYIKKPSFTIVFSMCYSEISTEDWSMQESFIYSSLWQYKQEKVMIIRKSMFCCYCYC